MHIPHVSIHSATVAFNKQLLFTNLSLDLPPGQWIALLGASGVGKTSLLRLLAGLNQETEEVNHRIDTDNELALSDQIAYLPQADSLLPWLTVKENALLQLKLRHLSRAKQTFIQENALKLLTQVGLEKALHFYPHQLSGGMRQRVALVRTLLEEKPIVLMDEPFSALDAITRYQLQNLTAKLLKDKTVVFVTHDPIEALRLGDVIYIMHGRPATLKQIPLSFTKRPRDLQQPELIALQNLLFQELTQAIEE